MGSAKKVEKWLTGHFGRKIAGKAGSVAVAGVRFVGEGTEMMLWAFE